MAMRSSLPRAAGSLAVALLLTLAPWLAAAQLQWVKTAKSDGTRLTRQASLPFDVNATTGDPAATLVVDTSTRLQPILGFGGAFLEAPVNVVCIGCL